MGHLHLASGRERPRHRPVSTSTTSRCRGSSARSPEPRWVPERGADEHTTHASFGLPPYGAGLTVRERMGGTVADPNVTLRLETPVLYIYPPDGQAPASVPPLDVHVDFHGGVLSQFYPYATATGLPVNGIPYFQGPLTSDTTAGLTWKGVQIGATGQAVETTDTKSGPRRAKRARRCSKSTRRCRPAESMEMSRKPSTSFSTAAWGIWIRRYALHPLRELPPRLLARTHLSRSSPIPLKAPGWLVEILSDGRAALSPAFASCRDW